MSKRLPALVDRPALQAELGVTEHVAGRLMRQAGVLRFPGGVRKVYARRDDIDRLLEQAVVEQTNPETPRTGVSAWIRTRITRAGEKRYMVLYRRGGRGTPAENANTFRTLKEARARRDLVAGWLALGLNPRHELHKLLHPEPTLSLAEWFDRYIDSRVDVTDKTRASYLNAKDRWLDALDDMPLTEITPTRIQEAYNTALADLAPATMAQYRSVLRLVLDYAEVEPNPARSRKLRLPVDLSEEPVPPTSREWELIRAQLAGDKLLVLRLAECCGLRISEAVGLVEGDVDAERRKIRISKARTKGRSHGQRWLPVPDELLDPIIDRLTGNRDRRVFVGVTGHTARNALAKACRDAGVSHYHPHDLRHRRISLWVSHEFNLKTVQVWSGHSKMDLTNRYTHVVSEPHLDEWRDHWTAAYRAERLERRGLDYALATGPGAEGQDGD